MTIGLMLIGMFALVLINVPVAVSLGVVAVLAIWIAQGPHMLPNVALVMFEGATNFRCWRYRCSFLPAASSMPRPFPAA